MASVVVVIPTYNEKDNLPEVVRRIFSLSTPHHIRGVVVDDNSPDGTGAVAEDLARDYPLTVIHREKKEGLGRAYGHAFRYLLELPEGVQPDYVIQIDADCSHDPAVIPTMLSRIEDYDEVIGSRYVRGGRIQNWNVFRRVISRFGNLYAQIILMMPVHDLTAGFKCWRLSTLRAIDLSHVSSAGYTFQIEMTYRARKKGMRICEIPITFTERTKGGSKFSVSIFVEAFIKVLLLRFQK
jgi:dolichol-phosphate mannosyltransferase